MTNILPFATPGALAPAADNPTATAEALRRGRVCRQLEAELTAGLTLAAAVRAIQPMHADLPPEQTLRRWLDKYRAGGIEALTDRRGGKVRKIYGWESRALDLWNNPNRPAASTVALWLQEQNYPDATPARVRRYLKSLPATIGGENTPDRAGKHHHRLNIGRHQHRDESVLDAGLIWQGDGHSCHFYAKHPNSGKHYHPELTIFVDVRSHFCVGFWLSEAESAVSTLYTLSRAMLRHDHVPSAIHVDPGSGFVNNMLMGESVGWLDRIGIDVITAIPGNAKGKGMVEQWFKTFEERCGKRFSSYSGKDRTDDVLRRLKKSERDGKLTFPTLREVARHVEDYIESYNHNPQKRLGASPAEIWKKHLVQSKVHLPAAILMRPAENRKVRRGEITMFGRTYRHANLLMAEGMKVEVQYDLTDDSRVWVYLKSKQLCEAAVTHRQPWTTEARITDFKANRLKGQIKRLDKTRMEKAAQAGRIMPTGAYIDVEFDEKAPAVEHFDVTTCLPE